jgi:putative ABC transport system permease protein
VAVVSESFARRYWPDEDPLGQRFRFGLQDRTIVGVVGDIRVRGIEQTSEPQVYLPYQQVPDGSLIGYTPKDLVVRSSADPVTLLPAIRRIVAKQDPEQAISDVQTLTEIVDGETAPRQVQVRVLGAFAAIAVLLAGVGIHGLLAFAVSNRAQEIGVRIALGATARDILRLVLRQGLHLAAIGLTLGLALAYVAGRAMEAVLAGVGPRDLPTFLTAAALAAAMTVLGSLLPALRAIRVDPIDVIRSE